MLVNNINAPRAILAGCLAAVFGALLYNILPLLLGVAQDSLGFSDQQLGFLTSAYFVGFTLATISAFYWVRRCNWRRVSGWMALISCLSVLALVFTESYLIFLLLLTLLGCTTSAIYGIGTTYIGDTAKPARNYGFKIGAEAGAGAVLMIILPPLVIAQWGIAGLLVSLLVFFGLLTISMFWLPQNSSKLGETEIQSHAASKSLDRIELISVWLTLTAFFVYFCGVSALWAFLERIGNSAGYDASFIGLALALALGAATCGSLLAASVGGRFGLLSPQVVAAVTFLFAMLALSVPNEFYYALGACLFAASFGLAVPVQVTVVAHFDRIGKFVVLTAVSFSMGGVLGPAVAGVIKSPDSNQAITIFAMVCVLLALLINFIALKLLDPNPALTAEDFSESLKM